MSIDDVTIGSEPTNLPHLDRDAPDSDAFVAANGGDPDVLELDECPVCACPGVARPRELGAGTTITHPRRVFPCSTATPLDELRPTPTG